MATSSPALAYFVIILPSMGLTAVVFCSWSSRMAIFLFIGSISLVMPLFWMFTVSLAAWIWAFMTDFCSCAADICLVKISTFPLMSSRFWPVAASALYIAWILFCSLANTVICACKVAICASADCNCRCNT